MGFLEISENDSAEKMKEKSAHNREELEKALWNIWCDFRCIDLSNGDRKRFVKFAAEMVSKNQ